jgi:hypothetical protein
MKILHGLFDLQKIVLLRDKDEPLVHTSGFDKTRVNQYFCMNFNDEIIRSNFEYEPKVLRYASMMLQDFIRNGQWDNPISLFIDRNKKIRAHPGASRVLLTRFLGIQKAKCITIAQENEFQYFPEMVPITKKQFEQEYPDLIVEAIPNKNKENDDLEYLKRNNMSVYYEFDHFEIRPKNHNWGREYTKTNQDIQYGNKALLSCSHDLPVYTNMTQEQLDDLVTWQKPGFMDSYLNSYASNQNRHFDKKPMRLIKEPLQNISQMRDKYKHGCVIKIDKKIQYNPWELLIFIHCGFSKLCTSDNSIELIHLGAEGLPVGILPNRYSDVNYKGTKSKFKVAF